MEKDYQLHISVSKALSPLECPIKAKHVRSVIIATHRSKSAKPFWANITHQPIMEQRFVAWKFCHLLHKVLREGHENAVKHSQTHKTLILEVGKLWGHLHDGVGKCIEVYTRLLANKLEFHQKNANIPGSLALDFNEFVRAVGDDYNIYFQLCVEVFDYIEHILQVQAQIFVAINTYRLNSMTPQGQCRLAPLITLIQDSNPLYDICVRIMFRLHDGLPHDVLMGHRNRFNDIFKKLKLFYEDVRPLQYFSDIIQLPHLPESAPNFSSELDLGNYRAPIMVLPKEPEPEPIVENLVDLATAADNNSVTENALEEKEVIIRQLTDALNEKQMALEHYTNLSRQINNYQLKNESLEREIAAKHELLQNASISRDILQQNFKEMAEKMEQNQTKICALEEEVKHSDEKIKQVEEKFDKIKTMYTKLREEHIGLLRIRNEDSKNLAAEKKEILELREEILNLNEKLAQAEQTEDLNASLKSKSLEYEELILKKDNNIENLNIEINKLKDQLHRNEEEKLLLLQQFEEDKTKLFLIEKQNKQQLDNELKHLREKLDHQVSKTDEIDTSLKTKVQEYESALANKQLNIDNLNAELLQQQELLENNQSESTALIKQYEEQLRTQKAEIDLSKENAQRELDIKQQQIDELLSIQMKNKLELEDVQVKLTSISNEKQNITLELQSAQQQFEYMKTSQAEANSAANKIIASVMQAIKHSLETDFSFKAFEANAVLQQAKISIDTISAHLKNMLEAYKLHISTNTRLTNDFATSCIDLISALRNHHEFITMVAENTTDMENVHILRSLSNDLSNSFIALYDLMLHSGNDINEIDKHNRDIDGKFGSLLKLLLLMSNSFAENLNIGDLLQKELKDMDKMIEDAAQKMLEIQQNSKSKNEGLKLEVNEKILDSCTNLMQCIINLIKKSRDLQNEIVARGKGTFTEKEFYKRNSQWTEGLISASKSVAKGANYLVDAANKAIVLESNECFEIIVAAQEIAASTAQLVIASKVKASKDSQKLIDLTKASRDVSLATGSVVATVKDGCNKLEYKNEIDMTKLTTSQKKTMEMEMHIKVLQLEQALDNERQNLMSFRKKFYQSEDD